MKRKSYGNVSRAKVYPVPDSELATLSEVDTVGLQLTSSQATELARLLLNAAKSAKRVDVTAWRGKGYIAVTAAANQPVAAT